MPILVGQTLTGSVNITIYRCFRSVNDRYGVGERIGVLPVGLDRVSALRRVRLDHEKRVHWERGGGDRSGGDTEECVGVGG